MNAAADGGSPGVRDDGALPGEGAAADSAPLAPVGPTLQPMPETKVRMEWERIAITVHRVAELEQYPWRLEADVEVLFHFVPEVDESMEAGFPLNAIGREHNIWGEWIRDFAVLIGAKPRAPPHGERYLGGRFPPLGRVEA